MSESPYHSQERVPASEGAPRRRLPAYLRRPRETLLLLVAGIYWLAAGAGPFFLLTLLPGVLMLGSGVAGLLRVGEARSNQIGALGGALGMLLALPLLLFLGPLAMLWLLLTATLGFLCAGSLALREVVTVDEAPTPPRTLPVFAEVALDEALLGLMGQLQTLPGQSEQTRIRGEVETALAQFRQHGFIERPADFHRAPPAAEPSFRRAHARGLDYEHATFESGYEPNPEEPGRARWLDHAKGRTAHAWLLRQSDPSRPWLVCIHGYQMGVPLIDLTAFGAKRLRRLGLNLAFPVLPLHGPRARGRISGLGFIGGDFLDMLHAEAQAIWDIRRLLGWIRAQGGARIGVYGLSLGGYNAALLAGIEAGLDCVIAGIPATDLVRLVFRHAPRTALDDAERAGLERADLEQLMSVVSPLRHAPLLPRERRAIFGGSADKLVPSDQVRDLWRHWERPEIAWYPGAHLGFGRHHQVRRLLRDTLKNANLV